MSTGAVPTQASAAITAPRRIALRAILLLFWLIGANYWLVRHTGFGWDSQLVTPVLAALSLGFGLIAEYGKALKAEWLAEFTGKAIQFPVLFVCWAALIVAAGAYSSVSVLNDPPDSVLKATLTRADRADVCPLTKDNFSDPKGPLHFFFVFTTPLGRPYRLTVNGYLSQTIQVYPVIGATVSPRTDLHVNPTILLRPPHDALGPMAGGVRIAVWQEKDPQNNSLVDATVGETSILVGGDHPLPPALIEGWRMEALSQGIKDETVLAQLLGFWKKPKVLPPKSPLEPGSTILAIIYDPTGEPMAQARIRLTDEPLQDIPLEMLPKKIPRRK
jgi:hypothetical protein